MASITDGRCRKQFTRCRGQGVAGYEDDAPAKTGPSLFDFPVQGAAVEIGHADIRQDHIVVLCRQSLQRFAAGTGGHYTVPRAGEDLSQGFANLRLVIDDEYREPVRACLRSRCGIGAARFHGTDG